MTTKDFDVIIIGGGPAGLTSAIYTARADFKTLVLDKPGEYEFVFIENYFGFPDGTSKGKILQRGRDQAEKFGAKIVAKEALKARMENENYLIETAEESYLGRGLILSPGIKYQKPSIEGLENFEGRGVSYCVTCDGPFFKDKKVGVLGAKDYAAKEVLDLYEFTNDIAIFTNGKNLKVGEGLREKILEREISVEKEKVEGAFGKENFQGLVLESSRINLDGLFVAVGISGCVDFARSLGIPVEGEKMIVDENLCAGPPRLYAAGDCTGEPRQVATAVGEGAKAAINLIEDLKDKGQKD